MIIKDYALSESVKRKLGLIISKTRNKKLEEAKEIYYLDKNPYTKENFCENNNICHFHTLTKLEQDVIKEDSIYHILLSKLSLYFQLETEDHDDNMLKLTQLSTELLNLIEFLDEHEAKEFYSKLLLTHYDNDCIANLHVSLMKYAYVIFFENIENEEIVNIEIYLDLYQGLFKAIAFYILGVYYLYNHDYDKSLTYCLSAKSILDENNVSIGISNYPLIDLYVKNYNYFEAVKLCYQLEDYYNKTKNDIRLIKVYNYLSDYYLLINSISEAKLYYNKAIEMISNNEKYQHLRFSLDLNWGMRLMKEYRYDEAYELILSSYQNCIIKSQKLLIINRLLILYTILKHDDQIMREKLNEGIFYFDSSSQVEQNIFKYFKFKYEYHITYFRRYAKEVVIPMMREQKDMKIILLFFYEDLFNKYV